MNEAMGSTIFRGNSKYHAPIQADSAVFKPSLAESSKQKEPVSPSPPQSSLYPSFQRKGIAEELSKDGKEFAEQSGTIRLEKRVDMKSAGEVETVRDATIPAKKQPEEIPISSNRPSNPFAKKSNVLENSSLFNSLKKMKTDTIGKR